jgi:signal transduction histidine kinase
VEKDLHHRLRQQCAALRERTAEEQRRSAAALETARAILAGMQQRDRHEHSSIHGLLRAKAAAERSAEHKRQLVGAVAHDLKQPLQVLAMALERMARRVGPDGALDLARGRRAIDAIGRGLDDLLDAVRVEAAPQTVRLVPVALLPLLDEIAERLRPLAEAKRLALRVCATDARALSDRRLLASILQNLLANAITYTADGGVLVGCRRRDGHVLLQVVDTGPGIPEERIEQAFRPFERLDGSVSGGVGLGLAIVRDYAALLGHRVAIAARRPHGTVFTVELEPAPDEAAPAMAAPAP